MNPYKQQIFEACETTSWEETYEAWLNDEDPLSLSGKVGAKIRMAIQNSSKKKWPAEKLEKELIFLAQCLQLWVIRCQTAHDRPLEKPKKELFWWLQETKDQVIRGELTFPTSNGKEVVFEVIKRQRDMNFKYKKGGMIYQGTQRLLAREDIWK